MRELANDEPSSVIRDRANRIGFTGPVATCFLVVAVSPSEPLPTQRAVHILSNMGPGKAFAQPGWREDRTNDELITELRRFREAAG